MNIMRRDALLAKLVADYQPTTTMLQATCEHLAGTLEQLEVLKAGSQEHKRLVELAQLLAKALEESRASRDADTPTTDLSDANTDQLIGQTTAMLRQLLEMRDQADAPEGRPDLGPSLPLGQDQFASPTAVPGVVHLPEPDCPYCMRPCVGPEHSAYEVLHWSDPSEVEKRAVRATKEMMRQLGKSSPWL